MRKIKILVCNSPLKGPLKVDDMLRLTIIQICHQLRCEMDIVDEIFTFSTMQ